MINDVEMIYKTNKCQMMKLDDVCDIKMGKSITKNELTENGKYNVIGGGINYMGKYNDFNVGDNTITISKIGSAGYVKIHFENVFVTSNCCYITNMNMVNIPYLWLFLKKHEDALKIFVYGSTRPVLDVNPLLELEIPVPPLSVQKQLEPDFEALKMIRQRIKYWETKANELIQQLSHQTSKESVLHDSTTINISTEYDSDINKKDSPHKNKESEEGLSNEEYLIKAIEKLSIYDADVLKEFGLGIGMANSDVKNTKDSNDIVMLIISHMIDNKIDIGILD